MSTRTTETIERIKREVSVAALVTASGVELRARGKELLGRCPFHDDRTPSLVVTPEKNLWHCLGACQMGGSAVDWVMKRDGISFKHAMEKLRVGDIERRSPAIGAAKEGVVKHGTIRPVSEEFRRLEEEEDAGVLKRVALFYNRTLLENPEGLAYLEKRGIRNDEAIERFSLGISNRTLGYKLPAKNRKEGDLLRGRLERLGVFRESGHEHFTGSLVVPILRGPLSQGHSIEGMYGRKILERLREGTPMHLYLPGGRGVWNAEGLEDEVIVCESLIDALTFWVSGYRSVTCAYGVSGTEGVIAELHRRSVKKVHIAFDRDEAGDAGAEKLGKQLGMAVHRVEFPHGMDANEYACKVTPAEKSLGVVLRKSSWVQGAELVKGAEEAENLHHSPLAANSSDEVRAPHSNELAQPPSKPAPAARIDPAQPAAKEGIGGDERVFEFGNRRYRVRGLEKNVSLGALKVNIATSRNTTARNGGGYFVDTVELYSAKQRASYVVQAAQELEVEEKAIKREIGEILLKLEEHQESWVREKGQTSPKTKAVELSEVEREKALSLLKDPRLLERIVRDFELSGIVGEESNKLIAYLATVSRKLEKPLGVVIQSSSAAGKTRLMDGALSFVPEEDRISFSAMTGQSLFYMGGEDLRHKVLSVVEEEGAERASYALKLLQSEGELTIASTGKDPVSGKLLTHTYRVEGPVQLFLTTTSVSVDEELLNRCLVLTVDEGIEQTKRIFQKQREMETLEGLVQKEERRVACTLHKNAQRLLENLHVVNPFAKEITYSGKGVRARRDHGKYLTLMRVIALLFQHQREVKTVSASGVLIRYIEVNKDDMATAERLMGAVWGTEELPPQTSRLLDAIRAMVSERAKECGLDVVDYRFTRREVREYSGLGVTQLKVHMGRLEELEYLLVERSCKTWMFTLNDPIEPKTAKGLGEAAAARITAGGSGIGRPMVGPPLRPINESDPEAITHRSGLNGKSQTWVSA